MQVWSVLATSLTLAAMIALPILARRVGLAGEEFLLELSTLTGDVAELVLDAEDALLQTAAALDGSAAILEEAEANIKELDPLLESVQVLLGEDVPDTLSATQTALESTQSSARAMDRVLRALSTIRILTGVTYNPEQPLDQALLGVAESLEPLPAQLRTVSDEIDSFRSTLDGLEPQLSNSLVGFIDMAGSLRTLSTSISTSGQEIQTLARSVETGAARFRQQVRTGVIVLEIFALQFLFIQLMSWYVGGQLISENPK